MMYYDNTKCFVKWPKEVVLENLGLLTEAQWDALIDVSAALALQKLYVMGWEDNMACPVENCCPTKVLIACLKLYLGWTNEPVVKAATHDVSSEAMNLNTKNFTSSAKLRKWTIKLPKNESLAID